MSEELYGRLIKTTPYENIRMSVGRYKQYPHQWVEVWENGRWWIEDPALGNTTDRRYYITYHHLGWETILRGEGMIKELEERGGK